MFLHLAVKPLERADDTLGIDDRDIAYWVMFNWNCLVTLLTLIGNLAVFVVLNRDRKKDFANPFYSIIYIFVLIMMVDCSCALVLKIRAEALRIKCVYLSEYTMVMDLFNSYYSTLLIFLLGLNRLAVFSIKFIKKRMFTKRGIRITLTVLTTVMLVFAFLISRTTGMDRSFDVENGIMKDTCSDMGLVTIINYVFYAFPLTSSIFYLIVFRSLRAERKNAMIGSTKEMLNKAEKNTLNQGALILATYLFALMTHLYLQLCPPESFSVTVLGRSEEFISRLPQFALPISVLLCSPEMRRAVRMLASTQTMSIRLTKLFSSETTPLKTTSTSAGETV